ncbi:hypothetical protein [Streptomyces cavernae]|nr:hypothetical protein [Streptomyces cavernae]
MRRDRAEFAVVTGDRTRTYEVIASRPPAAWRRRSVLEWWK